MTTSISATILAVDDNYDVLYATRRVLRRAGYEVITASSIAEAEARWSQGRPSLVLLDVNLADGNGIELSHRWKSDPQRSRVPIILRSAVSVSAAEQALGLSGGADGYLIEPVDGEVLVATVEAHLRISQLTEHIELAVTSAGIGSMLWDGVNRTIVWRSVSPILLTARGDMPGTMSDLLQRVHGDDHWMMSGILRRMESNDLTEVDQEFRVVRIDGTQSYLRLTGQAIRNYNGGTVGFSAVLVDTSDSTIFSKDTERLVGYSIELASVETTLDIVELLERAALQVFDATDMHLRWRAEESSQFDQHNWSRSVRSAPEPLDALVAFAELDSAPLFIRNPSDFASTPFRPGSDQRSWTVLPFRVAGASGVLAISFRETQRFDANRQRFLRTFTNLTGLALAQTTALARQRNIANTLQQALLPEPELLASLLIDRRLVVAEASSSLVGGDWFDAFVVDDDHQVLIVGDVIGHGIKAASFSATFRHTLRTLMLCGFSRDAVLHRLDTLITRDAVGPAGTLLILEIEISTRTLTLTSAGHPSPILIDHDGRTSVIDVVPNTILGFGLSPARARSSRIRLEPGCIVIAFTDGLIEQRRNSIDHGYRLLLEALRETRSPTAAILRAEAVADARTDKSDDALFIALQLAAPDESAHPHELATPCR